MALAFPSMLGLILVELAGKFCSEVLGAGVIHDSAWSSIVKEAPLVTITLELLTPLWLAIKPNGGQSLPLAGNQALGTNMYTLALEQ